MIKNFIAPQLEYYRTYCNFVGDERKLFDYRAAGYTLDECCELMHMDISSVKRLSKKVNKKMIDVTNVVNMDRWIRENYS